MTTKKTAILTALYELRSMLVTLEQDFGLKDLSPLELDVLLAAHAVTPKVGEPITSDQIRKQELAIGIPQATYHRVLRSLLERGLIKRADGYKASRYVCGFQNYRTAISLNPGQPFQ